MSCVVVDGVVLAVVVEVAVVLGVDVELVSVDDDVVPAMDNTARLAFRFADYSSVESCTTATSRATSYTDDLSARSTYVGRFL